MEIYRVIKGCTNYPIGIHISTNLPVINDMAKELYNLLCKKYKNSTKVALFCKGSSGAIISGIVGNYLCSKGKTVIISHLKKRGESSHGGSSTENTRNDDTVWVVIDDFIDTGKTIKSIIDAIQRKISNRKIDILCVSGDIPKDIQELDRFIYGIRSK